jgi:regulator of cell morphogenesis and NO signaling
MDPLSLTVRDFSFQHPLFQPMAERLLESEMEWELPLEKLCRSRGISPEFIQKLALSASDPLENPISLLMRFPLKEIISYLRLSHRFYLSKKLPELELSVQALSKAYCEDYILLKTLYPLFLIYRSDLEQHILGEELHLFPFIENLEAGVWENIRGLRLETIAGTHDEPSEPMKLFKKWMTSDHAVNVLPLPYRIFLQQMKQFDEDLELHHRLEEEVMIPLATLLQEEAAERLP